MGVSEDGSEGHVQNPRPLHQITSTDAWRGRSVGVGWGRCAKVDKGTPSSCCKGDHDEGGGAGSSMRGPYGALGKWVGQGIGCDAHRALGVVQGRPQCVSSLSNFLTCRLYNCAITGNLGKIG